MTIFCCLVWAVVLGVQITDESRSLYIGSFCPVMTSLSRYLEGAAFGTSISSKCVYFPMVIFKGYNGHVFFYCLMIFKSINILNIYWPIFGETKINNVCSKC